MNFFFSRNVGTAAADGPQDSAKEVTARKIKQLLHEIIEEEGILDASGRKEYS